VALKFLPIDCQFLPLLFVLYLNFAWSLPPQKKGSRNKIFFRANTFATDTSVQLKKQRLAHPRTLKDPQKEDK
jgi:hypothetical protein